MIKQLFTFIFVFVLFAGHAQVDSTSKNILQTDSTVIDGLAKDTASKEATFQLPVFNTSAGDIDSDLGSQDVSSLLQSSKDVFVNTASFHLSPGNFRFRGYAAENQVILINGVNVNNLETGFSSWSAWGGLNDVTRYVETRIGVNASRLTFGSVGGYTNIDSKASSFKKGTRVSYASANRAFQDRVMLTHSTGMNSKGWAMTLSGSFRYADAEKAPKMYSPGTYFNAYSYYMSVDKRLNDRNMISFTGFGASIEQGRKALETQEAYDLAGSNYYNSYWGYQNGKVRNAKVSTSHKPMFMLSHIFNVNTNSKLTTSAFYTFGSSGLSGLSFYDDAMPRPDYYKYLPSYYKDYNNDYAAQLTQMWHDDVNTRQINWDKFYMANSKNLFTVQNVNGEAGKSFEGNRSKYILEDQRTDVKSYGFNSVYNTRVKNSFITAGVNGNIFKSHHYKKVLDLLGGDFWLDYDRFAEGLGVDQNIVQNNLEATNKLIKVGDKFGYDYNININRYEGWIQAEHSFSKLDIYGAVSLVATSIWREGFMANGKFPTTSKGESAKKNFINYSVKGGATYKLNGRNFITANVAFITRPPEATYIFTSPTTRNDMINTIKNEEALSYDINYVAKFPRLKIRLTYFNTQIKNQIYLKTYYHDVYNTNVNYIMTGVNTSNQGVELGVEGKVTTALAVTGAFCYGEYIYTSRPTAQLWQNNSATQLFDNRTVYLKNYKIGNMPQTVGTIGLRYSGKKFWNVGIYANYFGEIYMEPNPDRRTEESVAKYMESDPQFHQIIDQEKLPNNYTIDANAGKSWRIKSKYSIGLNVSITNLTNNQKFRNGGIEQLRFDINDPNKFPNKYSYAQGITYMAQLNFGF